MQLPEATSMLVRTPAVLDALLSGVPVTWLVRNDGPVTWSAYGIVAHLLKGGVANWLPRTRMILSEGAGRAFEPFDRLPTEDPGQQPVESLLVRFRAARRASLDELASLGVGANDLRRHGRHPEFGEVTLGQVLATWVAHDLTHLAQAAEVLARRYRDDVGPYRVYLPALDRVADAE